MRNTLKGLGDKSNNLFIIFPKKEKKIETYSTQIYLIRTCTLIASEDTIKQALILVHKWNASSHTV